MFSNKLDCFYGIYSENKKINLYKTDGITIDFISSIQADSFEKAFPKSYLDVQIAENCAIVKVFDEVYSLKKGSNPLVYEKLNIAPMNIKKTSFDTNLIFAIEGSDLYKFNG